MNYSNFFNIEDNTKIMKFIKSGSFGAETPDLRTFLLNNWIPNEGQIIHSTAKVSEMAVIEGPVYIGENVTIQAFSYIKGPVVILNNTLIGKSSFIRDSSLISANCIIGHSSEIARSIILKNTNISHIVAMSDSVIGSGVNFGGYSAATTHLLNDKKPFIYNEKGRKIHLNQKVGSLIGDNTQIGAYVQLNPGVVMEEYGIIYPGISVETNYYQKYTKLYMEGYKNNVKTLYYKGSVSNDLS